MTFSHLDQKSTTDTTSGSITISGSNPFTTLGAGDAMIVWAGGRSTANTHTFAPSGGGGGWTEIGAVVRCDYPSGPFGNRYGAMQAWWKIAAGTETSVTVTRSGAGVWRCGIVTFRSTASEVAEILAGPIDDTTGSTSLTDYTAPAFTAPRTLNVIEIVQAHTDISGTMSTTNDQGFTVHTQNPAGSIRPVTNVYEKVVTAGTITMPTANIGGTSRPWVSKSFALAAQIPPASDGWSVGFLKF